MSTKRRTTQATSRYGVNFVRDLVESQNSTFQEIDLHNDLGNDAYLEFVVEENATGCCVALQVKSGVSYRSASRKYAFHSDRDHFEYWASHALPVIAVVVDPEIQAAFWADITEHIRSHPSVASVGPYSISVDRELSVSTFAEFRGHCLKYREQYSHETNFGRAIANLSDRRDVAGCFDGLKALFSFHRNDLATWYYLISCLSNYRGHPILRPLVARLSHIPGHPDIFWGDRNTMTEMVRRAALEFMRERLDRRDAVALLSAIDESGIARGTIGQCVHALIQTMDDMLSVMESIAKDSSQDEEIREHAIMLAVAASQSASGDSIALLERLQPTDGRSNLPQFIAMLKEHLREFGWLDLY